MRRLLTIASIVILAMSSLLMGTAFAARPQVATATLVDAAGNVRGHATFREVRNGQVIVRVHASNLTPGDHGMHVHTTGACTLGTTPAFSSAGGHFNPTGDPHGSHAGDLGNISANPVGLSVAVRLTDQFTLTPGPTSLFDIDGSAIVVHADFDDLTTDPTGNSGARVLCGVIQSN